MHKLQTQYPVLFAALAQNLSCPLSERGIEISQGWFPLLFSLSQELNQYNQDNYRNIFFSQVKEKLGRLTCYLQDLDANSLKMKCAQGLEVPLTKQYIDTNAFSLSDAYKIVEKYESISSQICFECGIPFARTVNIKNYILPLCYTCEKKK